MTLTDFLLARIAEDEAAARTAGAWLCEPDAYCEDTLWENAEGLFPQPLLRRSNVEHHFDHIARHDPARVLAECQAKRLRVAMHAKAERVGRWPETFGPEPSMCVSGCGYPGRTGTQPFPCATLRAEALPYADHRDYRQEWKP